MSAGHSAPHHRETKTLQFARFITRNRPYVAFALIASTLFWFYPIFNTIMAASGHRLPGPIVRIDTNARALFPDHPYIHAQDKFSKTFGSSSLVAIAVVVEEGSIFRADVIDAIREITRELDGVGFESHSDERDAMRDKLEEDGVNPDEIRVRLDRAYPPYPVNHDQVRSLTHASTRIFQIEPDGAIEQDVLMKKLPKTPEEVEALRELVRQNPPVIYGRLVSRDEKGALITANFVTDRLSNRETYMAVFDHVRGIKAKWEAKVPGLKVYLSGEPIAVGWIITYANQILFFVLATVAMTFLLLWAYFRRWHGVFIPLIAATMTTIWGLGFTGWMHITFDPLVLVIPMIITARATSHTVQMAERFFEDYEVMLPMYKDPKQARVEVATIAMGELVVPGTLGIFTDVAGLLVIMVTSIQQMRDLAKFGAFWVTSIIVTVEILHPILICYMPAPTEHEHFLPGFMVRAMRFIGWLTTHPKWKYVIGGVTVVLFVTCTYIALFHSKIGEASPGTPLLWPNHEFNIATKAIAQKFGGVDSLVVYSDGDRPNASADADPIKAMERFERALKIDTNLGASISVVPFLRTFWQVNHYGDPKWYFVPDHPGTVRAVIFQLQQNGAPGFMRPFMTDDGRKANIQFFYPDHQGDTVIYATHFAEQFIKKNPLGEVIIRLDEDHAEPGAPFFDKNNLLDIFYYMLGPVLPARHRTMTVQIRQKDGSYVSAPVNQVSQAGLPDWLEEFRSAAIEDFVNERDSVEEGDIFTWPKELENWEQNDVSQWWDSKEFGVRAAAVQTTNLIVSDMKAVDAQPRYQPTSSWTRGVQFVMAGGSMGILAAINDEVERSHVANITLIFVIIFILHSFTYQSMSSGGIVFLQIATATMISLAYMAIRGVGLNINTLPVQSVGVGIGVDYAIYIVDRIRQECVDTQDIDEAVRRAVRTTGMAVSFTATTVTGGIFLWIFSDLRFQAEMAYLLVMLMILNMVGAITVVPAFYSILRPKVATALLSEEQKEALRIQKEREKKLGLRDANE
ncbi:MAG TPA: MMPL family transporter [Myxococcota bacterium]|nr:MMPL family transporter [Myxococcota bacterium]